MKREHLSLVARRPNGSYLQHPVTSFDDVQRVYEWLGDLFDGAECQVSEGS